MNAIDKRIQALKQLQPDLTAQPDLEQFWEKVDREAGSEVRYTREEIKSPFPNAPVYKIIYDGAANTPIHAWFMLPPNASADEKQPCIVFFHGYTGSKGYPEDHAAWTMMGYAVLAIDVRGQGGETGNALAQETGMTKGWITQGILDPETCYYRAISIDALRAVRLALQLPEIDERRVFVVGVSQGGGLALVASAIEPRIRAAVAHVPNMCHIDYGILYSTGSLTEAAEYVTRFPERYEAVLRTLSYFDVMNLAHRITIPCRVTAGLKDLVCMPETIFAAYNRIASKDKEIEAYPFMGHSTPPGYREAACRFFAGLS
ncbi:acetylxylan esterase [Paenibacillus thermoaerophilus]|uniref:Acetylxylan esterase n=1 Tax=Paenibacillus thermoaerophilus TaxID=1215385 RepID=A0ABW2V2H9_9BACL|nr:alpha/beta fold hydrolase [Paenibacillus thermoaerophilus]TMV17793.1 acetylxylan esterase [Paenibacillus thermoaerophilus]